MKKYEYQFIRVPRVVEKKGFLQTAPSGATFEACSDGYEIIFEREAEEE